MVGLSVGYGEAASLHHSRNSNTLNFMQKGNSYENFEFNKTKSDLTDNSFKFRRMTIDFMKKKYDDFEKHQDTGLYDGKYKYFCYLNI